MFVVISIHHHRRLLNYDNFHFWEAKKCEKGPGDIANMAAEWASI